MLSLLGGTWVRVESASAAPPRILTAFEVAPLAKRAVVGQASGIGTYQRKRCTRTDRLSFRCTARLVAPFGPAASVTVDISRTGVLGDDREHYRLTIRQRGSSVRRARGAFIEETRRAPIGAQLTLIVQGGGEVRVLPSNPIPVLPSAFDAAPAGSRLVGVPMTMTNLGPGRFGDALRNGARLITQAGATIDAAFSGSGDCDQAIVDIPAGETRLACVVFAVPLGVQVSTFEYRPDSGFGPETGDWALTGLIG